MFRNVCVEIDLFGLAVCAIIKSGDLDADGLTTNPAIGTTGGLWGQGGNQARDVAGTTEEVSAGAFVMSDSSSTRAFNIFKSVLAKCIEDVNLTGNSISDSILAAVYRYLCGYGNGLLSDPALHRVIYNLMTKLFKRLIGELKRLGTKLIYADFGRVVRMFQNFVANF